MELPGDLPLWWEQPDLVLELIEELLGGADHGIQPIRVLATVLFTDIVASTQRAAALGDRPWRELLQVHDGLVGRLVERWGGRLVKTTGDGILATFDGPGRAIGCAVAFREQRAVLLLPGRAVCPFSWSGGPVDAGHGPLKGWRCPVGADAPLGLAVA